MYMECATKKSNKCLKFAWHEIVFQRVEINFKKKDLIILSFREH